MGTRCIGIGLLFFVSLLLPVTINAQQSSLAQKTLQLYTFSESLEEVISVGQKESIKLTNCVWVMLLEKDSKAEDPLNKRWRDKDVPKLMDLLGLALFLDSNNDKAGLLWLHWINYNTRLPRIGLTPEMDDSIVDPAELIKDYTNQIDQFAVSEIPGHNRQAAALYEACMLLSKVVGFEEYSHPRLIREKIQLPSHSLPQGREDEILWAFNYDEHTVWMYHGPDWISTASIEQVNINKEMKKYRTYYPLEKVQITRAVHEEFGDNCRVAYYPPSGGKTIIKGRTYTDEDGKKTEEKYYKTGKLKKRILTTSTAREEMHCNEAGQKTYIGKWKTHNGVQTRMGFTELGYNPAGKMIHRAVYVRAANDTKTGKYGYFMKTTYTPGKVKGPVRVRVSSTPTEIIRY